MGTIKIAAPRPERRYKTMLATGGVWLRLVLPGRCVQGSLHGAEGAEPEGLQPTTTVEGSRTVCVHGAKDTLKGWGCQEGGGRTKDGERRQQITA